MRAVLFAANPAMGTLMRATEAERTYNEIRELLEDAVNGLVKPADGQWLYVRDFTDGWVVWDLEGGDTAGQYKATYTIADEGAVTLGDPEKVEARTSYETVRESDQLEGRVLEAREPDAAGGRVFRVRLLAYGTSRNGKRYTESVVRRAANRYEGAKAFDHHRTPGELRTSTVAGLAGHYRNVEALTDGLYGDLHVLPSAAHVAEALDASLAAQSAGLAPVVGISHDVLGEFRPATEGGRSIEDCTEIVYVQSADVVADPSAGGRVTRMVAGGNGDTNTKEHNMDLQQLLALLRDADATKRGELLKEHAEVIKGWGLDDAAIGRILDEPKAEENTDATPVEEQKEPVRVGAATEARYGRTSRIGQRLIRDAVTDANLDERLVESVARALPEQFTEAELDRQLESMQSAREALEAAGLGPRVPHVQVTVDEQDKLTAALDAFFSGDFENGFRSFKEAFFVFTGRPRYTSDTEDVNRLIMRESIGNELFDSTRRSTESADTTTWAQALGDSITRRMVAEYGRAGLDDWRTVVSGTPPIQDFRTQRIDRFGGYGTLPAVNEGAPYQPLTTPGDEEATYGITKRGGTEDLTLETIANDDVRLISRIPARMGLAAAKTLRNFVWDFLVSNTVCSYDSVALFDAAHANTTAAALSQASADSLRTKMIRQTAYGDASDILDLTPATIVVPPDLQGLAFQLATSAVALPSGAPVGAASNIPNIHQGLRVVMVSYLADANDWFLVADPSMCPLIEVGFYQGRQTPELFSQTDPTSGAVFNADKVTYKIRHIYGGTIVDHRGFQRGTQ